MLSAAVGVVLTSLILIAAVAFIAAVLWVAAVLASFVFCVILGGQTIKWAFTHTEPVDIEELRNDLSGLGMLYRAMVAEREGRTPGSDSDPEVKH